ncbi:hypothetical protein L5515_012609 [Caenorhabditis briggsae]|uniref:Ubiquitin carboxyl-terminal hydrolase n=1 Tax=Caenorhabditis briggsae TaxID=6238 RepID=A0AAE9EY03_CAEBR|nr:hypothetical protein L5515_012609 [Caenorhabditis briggsae]
MSPPAEKVPETAENDEKSEKIEPIEEPGKSGDISVETTVEGAQEYFKTKKMRFGPIDYQIVTQNLNGPCPLIAIMNALVLKGKITLGKDYVLPATGLIELLSNLILAKEPAEKEQKEIYESNVDAVIRLMPKLVNGLDVNVKFSSISSFEFTPALSLFDLVAVDLYHVWLPDPQFPDQFRLISALNYNELAEKVCINDETVETQIIKGFYEDSISQITFQGLASLLQTMKDGDIAVVFQNNHFSTIHKRRNEIFKLVSDEGLADEPEIVWETFSSVDGDSIFVNADFNNFKPTPQPAPTVPQGSTVIHSTIEHQDDVEIGVEARPSSAPPTSEQQAPPTYEPSGSTSSRIPTSSGIQKTSYHHQNVTTPRGSQERKGDSGKNCVLM